jgi:hypothetical protein
MPWVPLELRLDSWDLNENGRREMRETLKQMKQISAGQ